MESILAMVTYAYGDLRTRLSVRLRLLQRLRLLLRLRLRLRRPRGRRTTSILTS